MRQEWINKEGNPDLLLIVLGWACDSHAAGHLRFDGYDILCTSDYRVIESDREALKEKLQPYRRITVLAWSFGVWVFEYLRLHFRGIPIVKTIAVNGTPKPVDPLYGIPPNAFAVTLRSIKRAGMEKFYERMYGTKTGSRPLSERPLEELAEELETLGRRFEKHPLADETPWTYAVIGEQDLIFPAENMKHFWREKSIFAPVTAPMPHYPFDAQGQQIIGRLLNDTIE